MKAIRELRVIALVVAVATLAACGSDSSVAPDHPPADLGTVLSEMTLPAFAGSFVTGAPAVPTAALVPSSCSYSAASQSFTCPSVTASGITLTRSFTLLNAAGTPQSQFDPATTAAVRTNSTSAGTIDSPGMTITVDSKDDMTLSGLLSGVHVLNGTSVMHMTGTESGGTTYAMTTNTSIANLVLPATAADKWPKSGQIIMDITGSMLDVEGAEGPVRVIMTFNGTSKVAMTMKLGDFSSSCTIDLTQPSAACG